MSFRLSQRSSNTLATVDLRMQAVVKRAIQITPVDFMVGQGKRTLDEQRALYGKGRSVAQLVARGFNALDAVKYSKPAEAQVTWTMNSNHLSGRAVDLWVWKNGGISWETKGGDYAKIAVAMKQAAMELCHVIVWGGDWTSTKDYPHFELKRE